MIGKQIIIQAVPPIVTPGLMTFEISPGALEAMQAAEDALVRAIEEEEHRERQVRRRVRA